LTISGGLGQVNAALGTLSFLSNSLGVDQIDVATSDGRGGSDDHTIAINVVANQPPVTTVPVSEIASTGTPLAFTGANQISVADPDALSGTGENITVVLTDTSGLLSAFVAGSGGGAGITGSGTQQLTISGGLGQVNAALATLTFLGSSAGPDQIDVATSDGRGGSDDHKIAVNVVANQPPVTTVPASEIASAANGVLPSSPKKSRRRTPRRLKSRKRPNRKRLRPAIRQAKQRLNRQKLVMKAKARANSGI